MPRPNRRTTDAQAGGVSSMIKNATNQRKDAKTQARGLKNAVAMDEGCVKEQGYAKIKGTVSG